MKKDPIFRFSVADYLADTAHLSTQEHGAYLLLIFNYWQAGHLPNDDKKLAAICRLPIDQFLTIKNTLKEFFKIEEKRWVHFRIEKEISEARARTEKAKRAGEIGLKSRYSSVSQLQAKLVLESELALASTPHIYKENARGLSILTKEHNSLLSLTSPLEKNKKINKKTKKKFFEDFWSEWISNFSPAGSKPKAEMEFYEKIDAGFDPELIQAGIAAYRRYCDKEAAWHRPAHAVTWLKNERWGDVRDSDALSPATQSAAEGISLSELPLYREVQDRFLKSLGEAIFKSWLNPAKCIEIDAKKMVLETPLKVQAEWLKDNASDILCKGRFVEIRVSGSKYSIKMPAKK